MKKITASFVLSVAAAFSLYAQSFENTYDTGSDDYANMSVITSSGEIFTAGSSSFMGAGDYDALLMKSDAAGNVIWHKQYGGSGREFGTVLLPVADGFVIAGRSNSFSPGNFDILLLKTDINGDLQWAKTYGSTGNEFATYIAPTVDNGFIVTGQTTSFGSGGQDAFLLKTDASGNAEWFKTFGSNSDELAYFVAQADDKGFIGAGASTGFGTAGLNDMYLFKTDSLGRLEAQLLIGGPNHDEVRRLAGAGDKGLILAGNTGNDMFAGLLNTQSFPFIFDWFYTFGGAADDDLTNLVEIPGQGFAMSGFTSSFGTSVDGLVFAVDTNGNVGFSALLAGNADDIIQDVILTNNGGLLTGYSNSFGGAANDIFMTIIGDNPPCIAQGALLTITPQSPAINFNPPNHAALDQSVTASNVVLIQSSATVAMTDVCPEPLAAHAGNDVVSCGGSQVQIGGTPSATGGEGPYSYMWSPAIGLDDPTSANPMASPTVTTIYSLTVTDNTGATATDDVIVVSDTVPTVTASPADTTICAGEAVILVASGADSYSWSPADGLSATNIPDPAASPASTTVYTVTGFTLAGCYAAATVTLRVLPSPNVTVTPPNPAICGVDSIMLTASGAATYLWSPAAGLSAANIANPIAFPASTTTYNVTGTSGACSAIATVTVSVDQPPVADINPPAPNICEGQNVTLTASGGTSYSWNTGETTAVIVDFPTAVTTTYSVTVTNACGSATASEVVTSHTRPSVMVTPANPTVCETSPTGVTLHASGAQTYQWTPATGLSSDTSANPVARPSATTTYSVTGRNAHCAGNPTLVTVTVIDFLPAASISPPAPNICEGQNVTLTASGGTSYSWSTGATTAVIVEVPTSATTTYSVTVTNACGSATASEVVTRHTRPAVTVTPANPSICDTASTGITLHASGAQTYQWTPATGLSSDTSANPVARPSATTTYSVTGRNAHCAGNPAMVTVTVEVCTGIQDISQPSVRIFPNPAVDALNISVFSDELSQAVLALFAANGRIVLENRLNLSAGNNSISLDIAALPSGLYYLRIKSARMVSVGKVVVE